jgi:hypothetical protein
MRTIDYGPAWGVDGDAVEGLQDLMGEIEL